MRTERNLMITITHHRAVRATAAAGLVSLGLLVAACGSSGSSSAPTTGGSSTSAAPATSASSSAAAAGQVQIKTESVSLGTVLTNAQGFSLYWFAPDTSTHSACTGSCATYWPPVIGTPTAASGVTLTGKFGTITRSDGTTQATYNGHPLYTYKGDTSAGQVTGNGLNVSGGLWYAVTSSGSAAPQPSMSASSSSKGYGY
jgi:predicted lipoprotein with Yx(FWY)xxD motif